MNGAESLVRTAVQAGVEVCFTNPGTTEMHLVAAMDSEPGMRGVLALFEGVLTGAADGYGRMLGRPAMTLLHLGPGFGNGIANLHNARRARSPIVNVIGHHATWQRNFDAPLNSDVETLVGPVSAWQRSCASVDHISFDTAAAIAAAQDGPGQIASMIVPADVQWGAAPDGVQAAPKSPSHQVSMGHVEDIAKALRDGGRTMLLLGGHGLRTEGLRAAGAIAEAFEHVELVCETFPARMERGPETPALRRLPYFPEQVMEFLEGVDTLILAGALEPVSFFGYEKLPARLVPDTTRQVELAVPEDDVAQALVDLAVALDATTPAAAREVVLPEVPRGGLTPSSVAQAIVAHLPENCIVVDEGVTSAGGFFPASASGPTHTYLNLTGGSIGWGIPCGLGAAIACPDRRVVVLEGDGSGLYTAQGLWTMAREQVDATVVVFVNDVYRILQVELMRTGVEDPGRQSLQLTTLDDPAIDWPSLAKAYGVPTSTATTAPELASQMQRANSTQGPHLIVARMADGAQVAAP